jgi:hypothetical protein
MWVLTIALILYLSSEYELEVLYNSLVIPMTVIKLVTILFYQTDI